MIIADGADAKTLRARLLSHALPGRLSRVLSPIPYTVFGHDPERPGISTASESGGALRRIQPEV